MAHVHLNSWIQSRSALRGLVWQRAPEAPRRSRARIAELAGERQMLSITVSWGSNVLCVRHLEPPRAFRVGDDPEADLVIPEELGGAANGAVVELEEGTPRVVLASGERRRLELHEPIVVWKGDLSFHVELARPETAKFPAAAWDRTSVGYFAASLVSMLGFAGLLASFVPPLGLTDEEELDRDRLATMLQYLDAQAERERLDEPDGGRAAGEPSAPSAGAQGSSGALGKPTAERTNRRFASNAPAADRDTTSRADVIAEAVEYGMIGLLNRSAPLLPGLAFERDGALNPLDQVALGAMFGSEIGENRGTGLNLSGTGEGSGGPGGGIGMGDGIGGLCQNPAGCQNGEDGWGRGSAVPHGTHATTPPRVRTAQATVDGVLPAEVVQRIVRQNFGRFRHCYEDGLRRNPTLNGRVTARFLIDRTGAVSIAQNGGSDLPDSAVVACVVNAFYGLSFPTPANGGTVRVSYPIMFSVG